MEIPREQPPQPSGPERAARIAVLVFLGLATLVLAFGLGFGLNDMLGDDDDGGSNAAPVRGNDDNGSDPVVSADAALIDEIIAILKEQYVDRSTLDEDLLNDAAIDGLITSLNDRETQYIPPEDLSRGALQLNSTYQGIGASVSDQTGEIQIVAPFRDSPAEAAGIRAGDVILEVDGEVIDGWTDDEAVERIRGPKGTTVTLKVRHADGSEETLSIERGDIDIDSVFREPNLEVIPGESGDDLVDSTGAVADDIAYLSISQFHDKTLAELEELAGDIESQGFKGLILDLRSNPGGGLQATIDVTDEFLDEGIIIQEVDAEGRKSQATAGDGGILTEIPIVVLMDAGSASGSEVLAAALRDNGRATIIGTRSFGKGTVNRLVPLQDCGEANCGALYLSIGRWLTPNGEQIEGLGIEPDIELEMTADQYIEEGDIQIFRAIEVLRGTP